MKYVGITRKNKKQRWNNGNGYTENQKFYKDIQKYGWDDVVEKTLEVYK